jgi:catechol 2,3-dioxygenase-like lactoylglutathione lyase family enzyme
VRSQLPGIDHPLVLVRDIAAARAFYTHLGFTLTPVGLHPWGTSTSLAVMHRSALELMGIYDETLIDELGAGDFRFGRHMRDALAEREGLALVALHSRDSVADAAALAARGVASQGHIDFRRRVKPPGRDWDEAVVSLEIFFDPALPRVSHFIAQQHKPELLWVPEWMRHPNGARAVAAVTYIAEDPAPLLRRLGAMFDAPAARGAGWEIATGQGLFRVLQPDRWQAAFADTPRPAVTPGEPAGVAIDIEIGDLAALRVLLQNAGIETCETPGGLAVRDVPACGNTVIRFVTDLVSFSAP